MKKIAILSLCLLFLGASLAAAAPGMTQTETQTIPLAPTGTFEGNIGYKRPNQNATIIGTLNGTYEARVRGYRFIGEWETENNSGTLRGAFGRHFLVGRVSTLVNGTQRSLPIVGFIRYNETMFIGRFMAPVGPALYFWGSHT